MDVCSLGFGDKGKPERRNEESKVCVTCYYGCHNGRVCLNYDRETKT